MTFLWIFFSRAGTVDSDRLDNYDNYWINKLACIDESHSVRNNLDIDEAEEKLQNIMKYTQRATAGQKDSAFHQILEKDNVSTPEYGFLFFCLYLNNKTIENIHTTGQRLFWNVSRAHPEL